MGHFYNYSDTKSLTRKINHNYKLFLEKNQLYNDFLNVVLRNKVW